MRITWTVNGREYAAEAPDQLSVYIDVLGVETAVKFILHYGGTPLYLAANPGSKSELVQVIGMENAVALSAELRPGQIGRVPLAREFMCSYFLSLGYTKLRIARTLKITDETVRRSLTGRNRRRKAGIELASPGRGVTKRKRLISI